MLLENKNILVFAATGAIAGEAARSFAAEGAHVYISRRNQDALETLTAEIQAAGGAVDWAVVDATDAEAVEAYVAEIAQTAGAIHGVFNGIGGRPIDLHYPQPSDSLALAQFMVPMERIVGSQFITSRTAANYMAEGGAIVTLSATLSGMTAPAMAGISAACGAIEAMTRSLAGEYGMKNIRVNCVRGSGMPETRTIQETVAGQIALTGEPPKMNVPPIGRPITVSETISAAAFLMSDQSSGMTGQVITVCGGVFV
ncbi:MAG: SDR family oxidoreductase [Anaerolineae bacterium]|nr:SDR family oxidoreductase [Anaerolineae bacterium]